MKNLWIEQEEKDIKREICGKKLENENSHFVRILVFLFLISVISYANLYSKSTEFRGVWGETWICPNSNCGYENYNAIQHCAICGTKKK